MFAIARTIRAALIVAAFTLALAAWQGAAAGALDVTGVTVDGVTSTSTPPGGVLEARVTVKATASSRWRATLTRIGTDDHVCHDHDDGQGNKTASFNLAAPGTPGSYDLEVTAAGANNCGGEQSAPETLTDAIRVTAPAPNPNLAPRCGINVMLVLDESGSIQSSGATEKVRNAARAFLDALSGTGATVSIVDFSSSAARPIGYTTVTPDSIATVFEPYLVNGYRPNGWTNWEDAFSEVKQANAQGPRADLVVFITDGDPTARNSPSGQPITGLPEGDAEALRPAAIEADQVKGQGSHVFAIGVGAAVTRPVSARRLTAVSGFDEYPDPVSDFSKADFTLVEDFDDLAEALQQIAVELCRTSVTVTKLVDEGDGVYRPDPGWRFEATVTTKPGKYTWLQPPPPPASGPRSQTTDQDGVATFQWKPANASATSTVTLVEDLQTGYEFVDYTCVTGGASRAGGKVRRGAVPTINVGPLGAKQYARCTVRNRIIPGTIEIEKDANPEGKQPFTFIGSAPIGGFVLVDDGAGPGSSSRIFAGLAPGTYTVREVVPDKWALTGVTCSDPAVGIAGPEVTITLAPGDSVVCTYRDTRVDPPVPPEPPTPPTPPTPPPTPPETGLTVVKTTPRVARIGDRLPFSLTVTNTGSVAAKNVVLLDAPPGALTLSGLRSNERARLVRGYAVWRLGTLAPGAKRTVHGTVLIKAGTPGLKRNIAIAGAINAPIVSDQVDMRVRAARGAVVPVTG